MASDAPLDGHPCRIASGRLVVSRAWM